MVSFLSAVGGQKARVVFAELACREPDVLILVSEPDCMGGHIAGGSSAAQSRNASSTG